MNSDLKKILSALILIIGYVAFIISTSSNNFPLGLIYLSLTIILWLSYVLILDIFDIRFFATIISFSGFMVAIAIFFLFGIEEVPYPIGAIVFHLEGIAGALGVCLFSFLPIIPLFYLELDKANLSFFSTIQPDKKVSQESKIILDDNDEWEIASDNDLQSGEFEIG